MESVPLTLALSNLIGVEAVLIFETKGLRTDAWVLIYVILASIFMHLSETKHELPGLISFGPQWLWVDRVTSLVGLVWFGYRAIMWSAPWMFYVQFVIGLISLALGEQTRDLFAYFGFHLAWHVNVFYLAKCLAKLA